MCKYFPELCVLVIHKFNYSKSKLILLLFRVLGQARHKLSEKLNGGFKMRCHDFAETDIFESDLGKFPFISTKLLHCALSM